MKNILFIGAGASFGARCDEVDKDLQIPLGKDLLVWMKKRCTYLLDTIDVNGHIFNKYCINALEIRDLIKTAIFILDKGICDENAFKQRWMPYNCRQSSFYPGNVSTQNYEEFISSIHCKNCRIVIQKLLRILFCDLSSINNDFCNPFIEKIDLYDSLIEKLKINKNEWSVISLNYDLFFEDALKRASIPFSYFGIDESEQTHTTEKLGLFKPHGSINFFSKPDIQTSSTPEVLKPIPTSFIEGTQDNTKDSLHAEYPHTWSDDIGYANIISEILLPINPYPIMANFAPGKESETNNRTLNKIRSEAITAALNATHLFMIGIKPIDDHVEDSFVTELLKIRFDSVTYVTKCNEDANFIQEKYSKTDRTKLEIFSNGIGDFIKKYDQFNKKELADELNNYV